MLFPFSNRISTFRFLGFLGPFCFWIFLLGLIAPFPFYSTFDVATTIVELQQLHRNSSVIKGIITYNLFLLKFEMNLKNVESNPWHDLMNVCFLRVIPPCIWCMNPRKNPTKSWVEWERGYQAQRENQEMKWAQNAKEPRSTYSIWEWKYPWKCINQVYLESLKG